MSRKTLAAAVCLAATAGCGSDSRPEGPAQVRAVHYDYAFDLSTRQATVAITLDVESEGNCFDMPVRAEGFDLVVIAGEDKVVSRVEAGLLTACGAGWEVGQTIVASASGTVEESVVRDSQVGFSRTLDIEGGEFTYLVSWIGGCDRFGPCQAAPDRFATYTFRVSHPAGTTVLCSGDITETPTQTTCDFAAAGGPTYSTFGLMASPSWVTSSLGTWGSANVTLYDFPTADLASDIDSTIHAGFVAFMEENFGPYPFGDTLRIAAGPTYWNGFEHPGNISISERLNVTSSLYANPLEHTINHELAHMWAGDQTTLAGTYDFVWKEAMAEYLTFVFTDERADPADALQTARAWKQFSSVAAYYPVPAEQPELIDYYGDVYGPGPLILFRHIEALYSREVVMTALRTLLGSERAIGVADIRAALEASTGADLETYFDQWVYGEGAPLRPTFSVALADLGAAGTDVTITQENAATAGLFGCAFAVRLVGANPVEALDVWFDLGVGGREVTTVRATPSFAVVSHTFDPGAHCLAREVPIGARLAETPRPGAQPWVAGAVH